MLTTSHIVAHLTSLLGPEFVREDANTITAAPTDSQQISTLLHFANEHHLTITPIGGGTKQSWGNPVAADLLLDTTRLNRVIEHPWQDLTCTVQAGCTWSVMQQTLAQHNQFVALDPLWPDRATVGGIVATNDSGALRHRYGSLRDLIIGMTIVLADGTIAKSGGKVVKNVAGYDLHKLMTGAFGTLGIIAEVTFRLHPVPAHTQTWTAMSPMMELSNELMFKILDSHLSTQAIQVRASAEGYALDVQLACLPEVLTEQINTLDQLANRVGMTAPTQGASHLNHSNPFNTRGELFSPTGGVVIKVTMRPTSIETLSSDVVQFGGSGVTQATGIMFARFTEEAAAATLPSLYGYVDAASGKLTILRGPERPLPAWAIPPWGPETPSTLMQSIKHQFDPNRILNPHRFLGGI